MLSYNPNAIHLLEQNPDEIDWDNLSSNPNAIHLLEQNQDKINWGMLSRNPNAIHLLEQNQDKIHWGMLLGNPSIFIYDYEGMKQKNKLFAENLIKTVFHPDRIFDRVERGMEFDDVVEEDFSKYRLPGNDIIMVDNKPIFATYIF